MCVNLTCREDRTSAAVLMSRPRSSVQEGSSGVTPAACSAASVDQIACILLRLPVTARSTDSSCRVSFWPATSAGELSFCAVFC